jgi:hypothetical protein
MVWCKDHGPDETNPERGPRLECELRIETGGPAEATSKECVPHEELGWEPLRECMMASGRLHEAIKADWHEEPGRAKDVGGRKAPARARSNPTD